MEIRVSITATVVSKNEKKIFPTKKLNKIKKPSIRSSYIFFSKKTPPKSQITVLNSMLSTFQYISNE